LALDFSQSREKRAFRLALGLADKASRKPVSAGERRELRQIGQIGDPAVADRPGDAAREGRGWPAGAQRRGVTPLVLLLKRSGNSLGQVPSP